MNHSLYFIATTWYLSVDLDLDVFSVCSLHVSIHQSITVSSLTLCNLDNILPPDIPQGFSNGRQRRQSKHFYKEVLAHDLGSVTLRRYKQGCRFQRKSEPKQSFSQAGSLLFRFVGSNTLWTKKDEKRRKINKWQCHTKSEKKITNAIGNYRPGLGPLSTNKLH